LFGSRLKTLLLYYLKSRKAASKDDVIDLLVSDRIKQTLSSECLKHVLSMEGDKWLTPEKLTDIVDVYMNSRVDLTRNVTMSGRPTKPYLSGNESLPSKQTSNKAASSASMPEKKMLKCFRCAQIGHRAADCITVIPTNPRAVPSIKKRESTSAAKLAKINHLQVESCTPEQHSGIIFGAKPILNVPEIKFPPKSFFTQIDEEMETRRRELEEKLIYDENKSLVEVLPNLNTDELMNEVYLINDDEVTTPCVCDETSTGEVIGVINNNTDLQCRSHAN